MDDTVYLLPSRPAPPRPTHAPFLSPTDAYSFRAFLEPFDPDLERTGVHTARFSTSTAGSDTTLVSKQSQSKVKDAAYSPTCSLVSSRLSTSSEDSRWSHEYTLESTRVVTESPTSTERSLSHPEESTSILNETTSASPPSPLPSSKRTSPSPSSPRIAAIPFPELPELAILDSRPRQTLLRDIEYILGKKLHFPLLMGRRKGRNGVGSIGGGKRRSMVGIEGGKGKGVAQGRGGQGQGCGQGGRRETIVVVSEEEDSSDDEDWAWDGVGVDEEERMPRWI